MTRKALLTTLLLLLFQFPGGAQSQIPYQQLLLLIAGPSGERIAPAEQSAVGFLNNLRGEHGLYNLQMGTMHFDRQRERDMLVNNLGITEQDGITVALVELSERGMPLRTLYTLRQVDTNVLQAEHRALLTEWSDLSGEPIPSQLRLARQSPTPPPASTGGPPPPPSTPPSLPTPPENLPPAAPAPERLSFEGIRTVVFGLQEKTEFVWLNLKDQELRQDHMDVPVRTATLGLVEAANNLRQAHEKGIVYPIQELQAVRAAGRQWKLTEPEFFLPVELRKEVKPLLQLLEQVEAIEYQSRS